MNWISKGRRCHAVRPIVRRHPTDDFTAAPHFRDRDVKRRHGGCHPWRLRSEGGAYPADMKTTMRFCVAVADATSHLRPLHADRRWPGLIDRIGLTSYTRETAIAHERSVR